jgi:hypothetical protein
MSKSTNMNDGAGKASVYQQNGIKKPVSVPGLTADNSAAVR